MLMNNLLLSDHFREWLSSLKDQRVKARILSRIRMAELGNFGDFASVGGGVLEMRVHEGPGYRVYLLLAGGDKSTQRRDIKSTIATWDEIRKEN
jgi:putative addiction module killer protein